MTFVDWFFDQKAKGNNSHMGSTERGWSACKREILKLIESKPEDINRDALKQEIETTF